MTALILSVALSPAVASAQQAATRRLSRAVLEDKVRGGWAGQMIGVSYGAPTEFRSNGKIIEGNLNNYLDWSPKRLENSIDQDDLYVEMTFAEVMDTRRPRRDDASSTARCSRTRNTSCGTRTRAPGDC